VVAAGTAACYASCDSVAMSCEDVAVALAGCAQPCTASPEGMLAVRELLLRDGDPYALVENCPALGNATNGAVNYGLVSNLWSYRFRDTRPIVRVVC
jgi:hypothetical protein